MQIILMLLSIVLLGCQGLADGNSTQEEYRKNKTWLGVYPYPAKLVIRDSFVDLRDSNVYKTVKIGNMIWMAENLRFKHPSTLPYIATCSTITRRCEICEDGDCKKNGVLYDQVLALAFVIDSLYADSIYEQFKQHNWTHWKGVCPEGWHLPDSSEILQLVKLVGGVDSVYRLRDSVSWPSHMKGTDEYGFSLATNKLVRTFPRITGIILSNESLISLEADSTIALENVNLGPYARYHYADVGIHDRMRFTDFSTLYTTRFTLNEKMPVRCVKD